MNYSPAIWFQVSRKYRTVARLPEGKTGMEALREATWTDSTGKVHKGQRCDDEKWIQGLGEMHCGEQYLRCYANYNKLWAELTIEEFIEFKKAGGGTYQDKFHPPFWRKKS